MANRYFNKQVTESRKPLAAGGSLPKRPTKKPNTIEKKILDPRTREQLKERFSTNKTKAKPLDNIRSKGDKMKEQLIGSKEFRDKLRKKKSDSRTKKATLLPKSKKTSESPERIKRQADYMKKHGKNEPRRKTLSVKNTYKKEVEGLKK